MKHRFRGWVVVGSAVLIQFLLEVTLGRAVVAPAVLVPLLVYLSITRGDYWAVEGAFWSGFMLDLLLHHNPGTSSLAMLLGIAFSGWITRVTTGAVRMTFAANALTASVAADLLFVFFASSPAGSGYGINTLLILPRAILPIILFLLVPVIFSGRPAESREHTS
jgi:hypothetical protein